MLGRHRVVIDIIIDRRQPSLGLSRPFRGPASAASTHGIWRIWEVAHVSSVPSRSADVHSSTGWDKCTMHNARCREQVDGLVSLERG